MRFNVILESALTAGQRRMRTKISVPWKAFEEGRVLITAVGLPNDLPFQRPRKYSKEEMIVLIAAEDSLKITSVKQTRCDLHIKNGHKGTFSGLSKSHVRRPGLSNLTSGLACITLNKSLDLLGHISTTPQKSMTYQFVSTGHGKLISLIILDMKREFIRKKSNRTCRCLKIILLPKLGVGWNLSNISHEKWDLLITPPDLPILL